MNIDDIYRLRLSDADFKRLRLPTPSLGRFRIRGILWVIPFRLTRDGRLLDPALRLLRCRSPKQARRLLVRIDRFGIVGHMRYIYKCKVPSPELHPFLDPVVTPINANIGDSVIIPGDYTLYEDRIEISPSDIFSDITKTIPFVLNVHPNRLTMGTNYITQSIPTPQYELPRVSTSTYERMLKEDWSVDLHPADKPYYGRNLLVAFTLHSNSYEDAIAYRHDLRWIVSDIVKVLVPKFGRLKVKEGDYVKPGDVISSEPLTNVKNTALGYFLSRILQVERVIVRSSYEGTVVRIQDYSDRFYEVCIQKMHCIETGDKISTRYGNKGVVLYTYELPVITDDRFPELKGRPVDIIISVESIFQRVTPAVWLEAMASMLHYLDRSIPERVIDPSAEWVFEKMKQLNWDGTVETSQGRLAIGWVYCIPTPHLAYKKLSWRAIDGHWDSIHPTGKGAQRTGEMELWTLQALDIDLFREFFRRPSIQNAWYIARHLGEGIHVSDLDIDLTWEELSYIFQTLGYQMAWRWR